jgi:hypothetical protein
MGNQMTARYSVQEKKILIDEGETTAVVFSVEVTHGETGVTKSACASNDRATADRVRKLLELFDSFSDAEVQAVKFGPPELVDLKTMIAADCKTEVKIGSEGVH